MCKKIICLFLLSIMLVNLSGCSTLRKKFTRKKKVVEKRPQYFVVEEYNVEPSLELYTKHYVYWRNWHKELIEVLGQNPKKDARCITEIVGNLEDMRKNLIPEKQEALDVHIKRMSKLENILVKGNLTHSTKSRVLQELDREIRKIKREFSYRKMAPFIATSFETRAEVGPEPESEEVIIIDEE